MSTHYASIILPMPVAGPFTYRIPAEMVDSVTVGSRVIVQFGPKRFYTGVVEGLTTLAPPPTVMVKDITMPLDAKPIVRGPQIRFWQWMADYYLCTVGEVFKAALPAGLKVESETQVAVVDDMLADDEAASLSDGDWEILETVRAKGHVSVHDLEKTLQGDAEARVTSLIDRGFLSVNEKLVERYRAIRKAYVRLTLERGNSEASSAAFEAVKRSRKQEDALVALMAMTEYNRPTAPDVEVPLDVLAERAGVDRATVKALEKKGLCTLYWKDISRFSYNGPGGGELPTLSQAQTAALNGIHAGFRDKDIVLLHGITSSGKTEIYIHLIDFVLRQGRQALMLVPEIALTTQLTERLQRVFGPKVLIYHSKFTDAERVELWRRLLNTDGPVVVLGARSAVFLPFGDLGLVIVDEEHEASYKQYDPAPRYNGRDAASVLARMHGAKTLFASATPTVETYYKATTGKFGLVSLTERYGGVELPPVELVDMRAESSGAVFSGRLLAETRAAVDKGRQAIFFLNRRGFAPVARCRVCGFTSKCDHCDVSLTYHKRFGRMQCHYCGCEYPVPKVCPNCQEPEMEIAGYGTERLEDELAANFEDRRILRMDLDTTRNKDGYSKIIDEFSAGKADILVGTQMVTKGLDFGGVQVVGVVNADSLINFPDFRSAERAFNMIEQVAGRAGRRDGQGKVIVQTRDTSQPILTYVAAHDYLGFYAHELEQRRAFGFPPFRRIINIYLKHRDINVLLDSARKYAQMLREVFGDRVMGPQEPAVSRVQNLFIRKIMLRMEPEASMPKVRQILRRAYVDLQSAPTMRGLTVYYDVDPV